MRFGKTKRDYTPICDPIGIDGQYSFQGVNSHGLLDDRLDELFTDIRAALHANLAAIASGEVEVDAPVEAEAD